MNYHDITKEDELNGDGLRTVLWVSGCEHHCKGCHNPQTWDKDSGVAFTKREVHEIITSLRPEEISGITFSGGDPLHPNNLDQVLQLCMLVKRILPSKTIWLYTGYTYEHLVSCKNLYYSEILKRIDVLVDGKFILEQRDTSLKWRGSANQRVIDIKKTLRAGTIVLHCD